MIEADADGYFVSCPALQGCYSQGDSYEEAVENIKDAIRLHVEDRRRRRGRNSRARLREPVDGRSRRLMTKLPRLTARQIISVLQKTGFSLARQSGSHMIYKNTAGKRVTVPFHAAKILHPKVLRNILRDADLSVEQLDELFCEPCGPPLQR